MEGNFAIIFNERENKMDIILIESTVTRMALKIDIFQRPGPGLDVREYVVFIGGVERVAKPTLKKARKAVRKILKD